MKRFASLAAISLLTLSACAKKVEAPANTGICWHMVQLKDGTTRFNLLSRNVPNLEQCASDLEGMRLRFSALGAENEHMTGAYQGQFLFLEPNGIFTGQTLDGGHYLLLVRTGDGRLAKVGVMPVQ